jgi:DNA-binding MarR family transcriptional regulator
MRVIANRSSPAALPLTGITYYLMSIANLIARNTAHRTLRGSGLSLNEWRVLRFVALVPSALASDVIASLGIDKTTVSRAIASLGAKKLVRLTPNPEDRRETRLSLSAAGRRLHDRYQPVDQAVDASFEKELSRSEAATLRRLLVKLHSHATSLSGA